MRGYRELIFMVMALILLSCSKSGEDTSGIKDIDRTVIVYIAADNNLGSSGYADNDISEMLEGYPTDAHNNLVLYTDISGETPKIVEIKYNNDLGENEAVTIAEFEDEDSADAEVMKSRIEQIKELYPAPSYGLVLWSHGFGWYPSDISYSIYTTSYSYRSGTEWNQMAASIDAPMTKSFGEDDDSKLEIEDLVYATSAGKFDFIIFDACFMACAEVAYELRESCDNLIVSSAEVLAEGFPYHKTTSLMLESSIDYDAICKAYFDYFDGFSGRYRSATIAHIKSEGIETLRDVATQIVTDNADKIESLDLDNVQQMDRRATSTGHIFVDALSYIECIATSDEITQFKSALEGAVGSVYNTPYYFCSNSGTPYYGGFTIEQNCGLTLYLPQSQFSAATVAYQDIAWSK